MIFPLSNPWIDPRHRLVTKDQVTQYMEDHGWHRREYPRPELQLFEGPLADDGDPIRQYVPQVEEADDFRTCMLDLISNLARIERRYAVEVLDEMLGVSAPSVNGTANGKVSAKELMPSS